MNDWRVALLRNLGAKPTKQNMRFLSTWQRWEGGHTNNDARYNWLNTTSDSPGALGEINSVGVKRFDSFQNGIAATVKTLNNGYYDDILKGLRSGDPYSSDLSRGLQTWVSGPNGTNPGYVRKIMGDGYTPEPAAPRAARKVKAARPQMVAAAKAGPTAWDKLVRSLFDDDPEWAEIMAGLDDRRAAEVGVVSKDGSLQKVKQDPQQPEGGWAAVIAAAQTQLGKPYVFGSGPGTDSFDCSDLIQWAYKQVGVSIPRTTGEMQAALPKKEWKDLKPGDLVMKTTPGGTNEGGHVVMYIGNGKVIAAPYTGTVVQIQPLSKFKGGNYHIRYVPRKG